MTCKDCMHYDACGGFIPSDLDRDVFDYCKKGKTEEIPDIDERCNSFKSKSDVVEVKHGEWEKSQFVGRSGFFNLKELICSECKFCFTFLYEMKQINYCPICGAKMDGKRGK